MIKFLPLVFLSVSQRIPWKNENAVYRLQISALVPEIFKFEKWVKYANEMADDVIHSIQYFIEYINRVILANLQRKTFKLGRLIDLQETHLWLQKFCSHGNPLFSRPHPLYFNILVIFSLKMLDNATKSS